MRFLVICTIVLVGAGWSDGASAAPVSGSWGTRLLLILEGPQPKVAMPPFALESLLQLQLDLSGLQIRALTALSTVGVEAQIFKLSATIGALTLTDIFLFSRNIVEVDQYYQVKFVQPDPGGIVGQYLPIFYKDLVTPYAQLALLLGPTFTEPVILRKKIVETQLVLSGLTFKVIGLFANFGSATASQWEIGTVFILSGQTVSGITVRSETYVGARRGFECIGECFPELQFSQGRVVPGWEIEYERLVITGVSLEGIAIDLDGAVNFNSAEGPAGIEYFRITGYYRLEPLALDITDILYFTSNLMLSSHTLITGWSVGDAFVTAIWTDLSGGLAFALREFITSFSLGNFSITSDLFTCASTPGCFGLAPFYQHDIQFSFTSAPWDVQVLFVFFGLLKPLDKFVLMIAYTEKNWGWRVGTAIQPSGLKVQEFFVNLNF
jgi:hypothetical protein